MGRPLNRSSTTCRLRLTVLFAGVISACAGSEGDSPADLVVRDAVIFTADSTNLRATALAVREGRLVHVGSSERAERWIGPDTRVVDGQGRLVTPGFHDPHVHIARAGVESTVCYLSEPATLEALREALRECAQDQSRDWILAEELNPQVFPPGGPPAGFLDQIARGRPMWVSKIGGHESYVNRIVLQMAGVDRFTPDPANGSFARDASGTPTGTLRGAASTLVRQRLADVWPTDGPEEIDRRVRAQFRAAVRLGVVSVQEIADIERDAEQIYAGVLAPGPDAPRIRLAQEILHYAEQGAPFEERIAGAVGVAQRLAPLGINAWTIKVFLDGDFGPRTAALLDPYEDEAEGGWRGQPYLTQAELDRLAELADAAGFQLLIHAIGDRAVRMALDAIEHARRVNGPRDARHQITHLHLIDDADVERFADLGVVANVQPLFADNHSYNTETVRSLVGEQRLERLHRFRDLLERGAVLAASTDYPVVPLDPLETLQAAITRAEPGSDAPPFNPEQRLTLEESLMAATLGAAYANFLDDESGSLEVGKSADFVMFDRDLFGSGPSDFLTARVVWTVIAGRDAYRDAQSF